MSPETQKLQDHLDDLDKFILSSVYLRFVSARETEIEEVKDRILMTPPMDQDRISTQLLAFGELECLEQMKTTFEDTRDTLKARIDEMIERENEVATTQKI